MKPEVLDEIYDYWFGEAGSPDALDPDRILFWMNQRDETDAEIKQRFAHLIEPAAATEWDIDALTQRQAIALVVLLDQFPRNVYRTGPKAYAYDHLARDIVKKLTAKGWDRFNAMEEWLLGLPFVHHEDLGSQDYAVMLASHAAVHATNGSTDAWRETLDQATRHRDLIRRFGRFPHRNEALGRSSSPEEVAFMAEHGRGF